MNCERAGELIERRTGDGPLPFSLRLHIFRCPSCAAEAKRMKAAVLVLKGMLPRLPADFSDAVANALRGAPGLEAAPVSVRSWVIVGAPMLAAVSEALSRQATTSPFLAHMAIPDRLRLTPSGVPVAPIGAARAAADRFDKEFSWTS